MEKIITKILNILEKNGFEAYLVGGFVRDFLLGISSKDVDICTNALPKDMHTLFNSTNNNYGSVNLKVGKYNVDITTFRKEFDYENRRPNNVSYINSLEEDLKRRDFTINAICMDKKGRVIDLENGVEDLNARTIKMIGDVDTKLQEDPLRILRAIRFATVLDFSLDENLCEGIKRHYKLVDSLSKERIKNEFDKILMSKNFLKAFKLMDEFGISSLLNLEYKDIFYVDDVLGMWAQISLPNMPFTNNEKRSIIKILEVVNGGVIDNYTLYKYDLYICTIAGKILNISVKTINDLYKKLPIKSTSDILITGKEIEQIVGTGEIVGKIYSEITTLILSGKLKNNNKVIKRYICERK